METTKLSTRGQVVIPTAVRRRRQWKPGQTFDVVETEEGVLLRPRSAFPATRLEDLGKALHYDGPPVPSERLSVEAFPYADPYEEKDADDDA